MECFEKPVWNSYSRRELERLTACPPDPETEKRVLENWDAIAKPIGGLGKFETLTARIGAVTASDRIDISRRAVVVMCADNGVVEEGVSQTGQEVTAAVAGSMAKGTSPVARMAAANGTDVIPVDIGINRKGPIDGVLDRKIRRGTGNFLKGPAMTEREAVRAIAAGVDMAYSCREAGYSILATGEMGIGNTTTSSAVAAALLGCGANAVTGRGAGLSDAGMARKRQVIAEALKRYDLYRADALTVLRTVGGLDIAGLAGVCIGGASCRMPVVLDGAISMAAALVAERLVPGTADCLIPSHRGREPAAEMIRKELGLDPVIDGDMALGEGTGAVMMFSLLDLVLRVYHGGTTFSDIRTERYKRF